MNGEQPIWLHRIFGNVKTLFKALKAYVILVENQEKKKVF